MKRPRILLVSLATLLAGCATDPAPLDPPLNPAEYECRLDVSGPDSRFIADVRLAEDGTPRSHHLIWNQHGQGWVMQFDFDGGGLPQAGDDWGMLLTMHAFAPGDHTVRVDLLRGGSGGDTLALPGPRLHTNTWIMSSWHLDALRAAIGDAPVMIWRVTDRRGAVRLVHRIPASALDGPRRAAAARRAELEAIVADYRNRCTFVPAHQDIVIT